MIEAKRLRAGELSAEASIERWGRKRLDEKAAVGPLVISNAIQTRVLPFDRVSIIGTFLSNVAQSW